MYLIFLRYSNQAQDKAILDLIKILLSNCSQTKVKFINQEIINKCEMLVITTQH